MKGLRRRKEDNSKKIEASQSFTIHLSNQLVNYKDMFINSYSFNFRVCSTNSYCVYVAVQIKLLWLKPVK